MKGIKKNKNSRNTEDIKTALIKKALGYDAKEVTEEYVSDENGEIVLTKKKVTIKSVPPDVTALKILLDSETVPLENMTEEELEKEKERLLKLLKDGESKTEK